MCEGAFLDSILQKIHSSVSAFGELKAIRFKVIAPASFARNPLNLCSATDGDDQGTRSDVCGLIDLEDDEDLCSAVGL